MRIFDERTLIQFKKDYLQTLIQFKKDYLQPIL